MYLVNWGINCYFFITVKPPCPGRRIVVMAEYRYLFYDLLTNTPITELPLNGVSFTKQLNSAGTLSANLLITDATENALSIPLGTAPNRTALFVERSDLANGVGRSLVWGGMIWSREYGSAGQALTINAREFESYLEKVFINTNYMGLGRLPPPSVRFTSIDMFQAVQILLNITQGQPNTDIGIRVGGGTSGVLVSPTYANIDFKNIYQGITDLAQGNNGFDFNVDVYYDGNGVPQKTMNLGYPQIGYRYSATDPNAPTLQLPGNITDYSYFEDGSLMATDVYTIGGGDASGAVFTTRTGYPGFALALNYSDITNSDLLSDIALGRINAVSYPPTTLKITQFASQEPTVGKVNPGDDVRVIIRDARFPDGLDTVYRVTALTVTPNETGGPEQITYSLSEPNDVYL